MVNIKNKKINGYPLSYAQKRMFVLNKLEPDSPFYNISIIREITGELSIAFFKKALQLLVNRHESLRTNFVLLKGEPVQIIGHCYNLNINYRDISDTKRKRKKKEQEDEIVKREIGVSFKLETDRLFRVTIIKKKESRNSPENNQYTIIIVMHHIISDGWSMGIFYRELTEIYNAYLNGQEPDLSKLCIQYKDYAEWEQSKDNEKRLKKQEKYWLKELSGELPILNLPVDKPRPVIQTYNGSTERIVLDKKTTKRLKKLAKQNNTTLFTLLFTIFNLFLYRITGEKDLLVGTPVVNRKQEEVQNITGCFINNLIIRSRFSENIKFVSILEETKYKIFNAIDNGEYPFEHLIEKLKFKRDISRSPMFNVMIEVDERIKKFNKFKNLQVKEIYKSSDTAKFDLKIRAIETQRNDIAISFEYNNDLFNKKTIDRFATIIKILIRDILIDSNRQVYDFKMLDDKDKNKLVQVFNNTKSSYPKNKTIKHLFEEQVRKTPDNIAVDFEGQQLTYEGLNEKSNKLARYLKNKKFIKVNDVVAVAGDRSLDLAISVIAIHKTGAAFLLVNNKYPKKRIENMLKNVKAKIILVSNNEQKNSNAYKGTKKININDKKIVANKEFSKSNDLNINAKPMGLACVVYTSGSTDKPKGIFISHRGVINNIYQRKKIANLSSSSILCYAGPLEFVGSPHNIFLPLLIGAKLIIYRNEVIEDSNLLFQKIDKDKVNNIEINPFRLSVYLNSIDEEKKNKVLLKNLSSIFVPGAKSSRSLRKKFLMYYPKITLIIAYGSSEYSFALNAEIKKKNKVLIDGTPTINTQTYVLNQNQQLCPIGIPGELYISGDGLAKEYINDKKRTDKAFLIHPFIKEKKIYKTGDIAKMHQDGNIEILGRVDHQIKIRGYRIEPGEIEHNLKKIKNIQDTAVIAKQEKKKNVQKTNNQLEKELTDKTNNKDDNDKYLVAYYTSKNKKKIDTKELKEQLKSMLPEYMIPSYFVHLKELPLNQNGKLDRLNLSEPTEKDFDKKRYREPKSKIEKEIVKIWQEILGVKKIGLNDNFFDIGGNSFKIIQVASKLEKIYQNKINIAKLFTYSTILDLSIFLSKKTDNKKKLFKKQTISKEKIDAIFNKVAKSKLSSHDASVIIKSL